MGFVKTTGWYNVPPRSVNHLKASIVAGPTTVMVDGGDYRFHLYQSGILDSTNCGKELTHAMVAIGYGKENDKEYFIVRNSYGKLWGEGGYIRISAEVAGNGVCGMLLRATRPVVDSPLSPSLEVTKSQQ